MVNRIDKNKHKQTYLINLLSRLEIDKFGGLASARLESLRDKGDDTCFAYSGGDREEKLFRLDKVCLKRQS